MKLSFKDILLAIIIPVVLLIIDKCSGEIKITNTIWTFIQSITPYLLIFYSIYYLSNKVVKMIQMERERSYQNYKVANALIDMLTKQIFDHYEKLLTLDPNQDQMLTKLSKDLEYQKFVASLMKAEMSLFPINDKLTEKVAE